MSRASGPASELAKPIKAAKEGVMNPLENVRMAFEALWGNRLRSFLALLGIVIGVGRPGTGVEEPEQPLIERTHPQVPTFRVMDQDP